LGYRVHLNILLCRDVLADRWKEAGGGGGGIRLVRCTIAWSEESTGFPLASLSLLALAASRGSNLPRTGLLPPSCGLGQEEGRPLGLRDGMSDGPASGVFVSDANRERGGAVRDCCNVCSRGGSHLCHSTRLLTLQ
jgi:hypothetical protein